MSRAVWLVGWIGVGLWSLLCAAAYGLFDLVGRTLARHADAFSSDPATVEGLWRMLNALHGLSTWAVVVVWAVVSLLILAVPWLFDRLVGRAAPAGVVARTGWQAAPSDGPGGAVIDLGPDQYSVGPPPGRSPPPGIASGGTVPRFQPRR